MNFKDMKLPVYVYIRSNGIRYATHIKLTDLQEIKMGVTFSHIDLPKKEQVG